MLTEPFVGPVSLLPERPSAALLDLCLWIQSVAVAYYFTPNFTPGGAASSGGALEADVKQHPGPRPGCGAPQPFRDDFSIYNYMHR